MLLNGCVAETSGHGPSPLSIGFSVLFHACVLSLLAGARPLHMPRPQSAYQQMIQGQEHKLVWYHFKEKLPEIRPLASKADHRLLRAEVKIPNQSIVSAPKRAPKAPQMIWQKAPEINTDVKFDSPNVVAVKLPRAEPPKQFVPPVTQSRKLPAPQIEAPAPPQIEAAKVPEVTRRVELAAVSRPLRDFKPPPARLRAGPPQVSYVEPSPSLAADPADPRNPVPSEVAETRLGKVYRPFEAPPQKAGKPGLATPVLPSPPPPDMAGNSPDLNVVVVGLNPGTRLPDLPPVARPATFSAGPNLNPKGGTGAGDNPSALTVPDLTIRSGNIDTRATIMARNTPPKSMIPSAADALRDAAKYITVDEIGRPSATSSLERARWAVRWTSGVYDGGPDAQPHQLYRQLAIVVFRT